MDFGRAFTFPFEDEDWPVKILVGTLLSFIPFMAMGYQVRVVRKMVRGDSRPLPGMDDLVQVLVDGVLSAVASLFYFLPLSLFVCLLAFPSLVGGDNDVGLLLFCMLCCLSLLMLFYIIPGTMLWWAGMIRYAESGDAMDFFRVGARVADVRRHLSALGMLWLTMLALIVAGMILMPFAALLIVGVPLLGFYMQLVSGHLIGQTGLVMLAEY